MISSAAYVRVLTVPRARVSLVLLALASVTALDCSRDERSRGALSDSTSTSAAAPNDPNELVVAIDRSGVVIVGARRLLLDDDIAAAFDAFRERAPRGRVQLKAHRATLHGMLVRVVDLAKEAGLSFEVTVVE